MSQLIKTELQVMASRKEQYCDLIQEMFWTASRARGRPVIFYFNCQRPKETTERIFAHLPWSRHLKDNLVTCLNLNYTTLALIHSSKALTISVHLVDHVLQFGFCWVLAQRPHDGSSSLVVMVPSPSLSNREKASLNSENTSLPFRMNVFTQPSHSTPVPWTCQSKPSCAS